MTAGWFSWSRLTTLAVACAAGALALANPAAASDPVPVTHALGTLASAGQTLGFGNSALQSGFADKLTFDLGTAMDLKGDFSWRNRSTSTIDSFDAGLYTAGGTLLSSASAAGANSSQFSPYLTNLAAGSYYVLITGIGGGTAGGLYSATLTALGPSVASLSPVPEPGSWFMMAAGLFLMGIKVRTRARRLAAADRTRQPGLK